jgi:hypothetical protein
MIEQIDTSPMLLPLTSGFQIDNALTSFHLYPALRLFRGFPNLDPPAEVSFVCALFAFDFGPLAFGSEGGTAATNASFLVFFATSGLFPRAMVNGGGIVGYLRDLIHDPPRHDALSINICLRISVRLLFPPESYRRVDPFFNLFERFLRHFEPRLCGS